MVTLLYAYMVVGFLVAVRLGLHVLLKLDRYDWHFNKMSIWVGLLLGSIAWPLLLAKPRILLNPAVLFSSDYGMAARARERDKLRTAPPLCGETIRYRQDHSRFGEETFGEFLFPTPLVEEVLIQRLHTSPHLANDDEGALLHWIRKRDTSYSAPVDVPALWARFQYVADELIRAGEGKVRCSKCEEIYPTGALISNDDKGKPGWNFARLHCHRGHSLLIVEKAHFLMRQRG